MGSASSKATRAAAGSAARRYPTRVPPHTSHTGIANPAESIASQPSSQLDPVAPKGRETAAPRASKDESITMDGMDPQYAASLRSLGAVQPNTMYSPSSTFHQTVTPAKDSAFPNPKANPAIQIVHARDRLAAEAENEFAVAGKTDDVGRAFLDVSTIRRALVLRDAGNMSSAEIERNLHLKPGVVNRLGKKGIFAAMSG